LTGNAGNDTLDGDRGTDTLVGGAGNDTYVVDETAEVITEAANEGTDQVNTNVTYTLMANVENLTLLRDQNINGTGNDLGNLIIGNEGTGGLISNRGDNVLTGLGGNDTLIGNGGNDTLDGGSGVDSLVGGDGSDTYVVDVATDFIFEDSGQGVDTVRSALSWTLGTFFENLTLTGIYTINGTGNDFENTLLGNDAANLLLGLVGDDTIIANGGNDTVDGGVGADSMRGGAGDDLYLVDDAGDVVTEWTSEGFDTIQTALTTTLTSNVEALILTGSANLDGTGNNLANVLNGNAGANVLSGGTLNDTLVGNAGNDTLDGGTGDDSMRGGQDNDLYIVNSVGDIVVEAANEGIDTVESAASRTLSLNVEHLTLTGIAGFAGTGNTLANRILGNIGANALTGLEGDDTLDGGEGNDTLNGGAGNDSMLGGLGDDTYVIDSLSDVMVEAADSGTDTVQSWIAHTLGAVYENLTLLGTGAFNGTGNDGGNVLTGNAGANLLSGLVGNDTILAGAGNDTLDGGAGDDSMVGGLGDDRYRVDSVTDRVVEDSNAGVDTVEASISYVLATTLEHLTLTGTSAIDGTGTNAINILTGNLAANALYGGGANDALIGNGGDDSLYGGAGNDTMTGGQGNDLFVVDSVLDVVNEAALEGTDTIQTQLSFVLAANFENLELTGISDLAGTGNLADNRLTGNSGDNTLTGLAGNDSLFGGSGNDTLLGGVGADSLAGGTGNDLYIIDATDVLAEEALGGLDTVSAGFNYTLGAEFENLLLTGAAVLGTGNALNNSLSGNEANNLLSGLDGNDQLYGGAGNDTLDGGAGRDQMTGGMGDDRYRVDVATDSVVEAANAGTDTVESAITLTLGSNLENLILVGSDAINATGNTLNNSLTGNAMANVLTGAAGLDSLYGGQGDDTLIGGAGIDASYGGLGDDTYVIDLVTDTAFEDALGGTDTVQSAVSWTLGLNFENLILSGTQSSNGIGNAETNVLTGNAGGNLLQGLGGADTLDGRGGNDVLTGGTGADTFVFAAVGNGTDTLTDYNAVDGGAEEGDILRITAEDVGTFVYLGTEAFSGGLDNSEARFSGTRVEIDVDGNGIADISFAMTGLVSASQLQVDDFLFN